MNNYKFAPTLTKVKREGNMIVSCEIKEISIVRNYGENSNRD